MKIKMLLILNCLYSFINNPSMEQNMKRYIYVYLCFLGISFSAFSDTQPQSLTVKAMIPSQYGWIIEFDSAPAACQGGGYNGFHGRALVDEESDLLADLSASYNIEAPFDIIFDAQTACSQSGGAASLPIITEVR